MEGMLSPDIHEETTGEAEVRDLFKISSIGTIAGCMVSTGVIKRNSTVRVIREGVVAYDGKLKTLKRFKDDVNEVKEGFECGILIENFNDVKVRDRIECYENKEVSKKLEDMKLTSQKKASPEKPLLQKKLPLLHLPPLRRLLPNLNECPSKDTDRKKNLATCIRPVFS